MNLFSGVSGWGPPQVQTDCSTRLCLKEVFKECSCLTCVMMTADCATGVHADSGYLKPGGKPSARVSLLFRRQLRHFFEPCFNGKDFISESFSYVFQFPMMCFSPKNSSNSCNVAVPCGRNFSCARKRTSEARESG